MYFVVDQASGQKYGPVDLDGLVSWVNEGRVAPSTMIEDASTLTITRADQIRGLFPEPPAAAPGIQSPTGGGWTGAPPSAPHQTPQSPYQGPSGAFQQPPDYSNYPRVGQLTTDDGSKDVTWTYIFAITGLCGCILAPGSLYFASQAKKKGHPQAKLANGIAIAGTALFVLWLILNLGFGLFGALAGP